MMTTFRASNGDVFESGCDLLDVTSMKCVDTSWRVTDANGHDHRWYVNGAPAEAYNPIAMYDVPTLIQVHDGWGYYRDGSRYAIQHFECRQCGELIVPGYTSDTTQRYIPGLRWCRINGERVTQEEFTRRYFESQDYVENVTRMRS